MCLYCSSAPLSGPLVIAETLGGGMSANKPMKMKETSKKDRYLFKRRDECSNTKTHQLSQGQASSSAPSAYLEGSIAVGAEDFVLQKRPPAVSSKRPVPAKHERSEFISASSAVLGSDASGKDAVNVDQPSASSAPDVSIDSKPSLDEGKVARQEVKEGSAVGSDGVEVSTISSCGDLSGEKTLPCVTDDTSQSSGNDCKSLAKFKHEEIQEPRLSFSTRAEEEPAQDVHCVQGPSPNDSKNSSGISSLGGVKKEKVLKRSIEELSSENPVTQEKKKKKKKKQLGSETSFRDPHKHFTPKKVGPSVRKSTQIGLAAREDSRVDYNKKNVAAGNNFSDSVGTLPMVGIGTIELELPKLLSDLHSLALDPFHGVERNCPLIVRQFFLRFRSLVYQKSLVLSPASETESVEVRPSKSSVGFGAAESNSTEHARNIPPSKPAKPHSRSDDPTIAGRKRAPSDRQEEIAAKRSKKISDIKSLAAEKRVNQKTSEVVRDGRESAVPLLRKSIKPISAKKMEAPARAVEPTMLVIKFPPNISLPSPAELKARFARFGPMDQSGLRVFWKSSTCRVVFLYKSDAQAACKYAAANNSLFGNGVRCYIREVGAPGPEVPESVKGQGDDNSAETRVQDPAVASYRPASGLMQQPLPQPSSIQLKSCLKKSSGDETVQVTGAGSGGGGNGKGTPRVKFMLGGDDSSRGEQLMAGNRINFNNNSSSFADSGAPPSTSTSTSVAMDFNSRNFQKVIPPTPSPTLQLPSQFAKAPPPVNNSHHSEMAPRNTHTAVPPSAPPTIDISQQMLSLLTRCNDVVNNVSGLLGYVPFHPL